MIDLELKTPTLELNLLMNKFMLLFRPMFMDVYSGIYPEDGNTIYPDKFYATLVTILSNMITDMAYTQKEDPVTLLAHFTEYWLTAYDSLVKELAVRKSKPDLRKNNLN